MARLLTDPLGNAAMVGTKEVIKETMDDAADSTRELTIRAEEKIKETVAEVSEEQASKRNRARAE
ncbi:MAG TPA: hypothetical protein VNK04_27030 [Gemmataceae bacterium]|jgi:ElaB/YqjD/DUF883 family membrane-anchored ribosome-binding protein|nr:hypothetical protein [Gemmataceae bacterium]